MPVLGTTDQVLGVVEASNADVIFVTDGALEAADRMRELVWDLEPRDVQVVVAPASPTCPESASASALSPACR